MRFLSWRRSGMEFERKLIVWNLFGVPIIYAWIHVVLYFVE